VNSLPLHTCPLLHATPGSQRPSLPHCETDVLLAHFVKPRPGWHSLHVAGPRQLLLVGLQLGRQLCAHCMSVKLSPPLQVIKRVTSQ
jgi:hypothetical protein